MSSFGQNSARYLQLLELEPSLIPMAPHYKTSARKGTCIHILRYDRAGPCRCSARAYRSFQTRTRTRNARTRTFSIIRIHARFHFMAGAFRHPPAPPARWARGVIVIN